MKLTKHIAAFAALVAFPLAAMAQPTLTVGDETVAPGGTAQVPITWDHPDNNVTVFNFTVEMDDVNDVVGYQSLANDGSGGFAGCPQFISGENADGDSLNIQISCSNNPDPTGVTFIVEELAGLTLPQAMTVGVFEIEVAADAQAGAVISLDVTDEEHSDSDSEVVDAVLESGSLEVADAAPAIGIDPDSLDFGQVEVGTTSGEEPVTVTNVGDADGLVVEAVSFAGDANFDTTDNGTCGALPSDPLDAGESCTVHFTFSPDDLGGFSGTATIESNGGNADVALAGEGVDEPDPVANLAIDPASHDFGTLLVGDTDSFSFSVSNDGDDGSSLEIDGIATSGDAEFTVTGGDCTVGTELGAGEACSVEVTFAPVAEGAYSGSLDVSSDANDVSAALSGSAEEDVVPGASLAVDPASHDFGTIDVDDEASFSFTVTNDGDDGSTLEILSVDAGPAPFSVTGGDCAAGTTLDAGESCAAEVTFAPTAEGDFTGTFTVTSDAGEASADLEGSAEEDDEPPMEPMVIPTMQTWGLILMAMLMLLLGGLGVRTIRQ